MNIKSDEFLQRLELSEKKSTKFALTGMLLGGMSIFIALGKSAKFLAITYGIFIFMISIFSFINNLTEKEFYIKKESYARVKKEILMNTLIDIILAILGIILIIYSCLI